MMIAYWLTRARQKEVLAVESTKLPLAMRLKKFWLEPDKASTEKLGSIIIEE